MIRCEDGVLLSPRIQVVSDLHVDVAPADLRVAPNADVLVGVSDTCEGVGRVRVDPVSLYNKGERLRWIASTSAQAHGAQARMR